MNTLKVLGYFGSIHMTLLFCKYLIVKKPAGLKLKVHASSNLGG